MNKTELKIVKLVNEDVIATSDCLTAYGVVYVGDDKSSYISYTTNYANEDSGHPRGTKKSGDVGTDTFVTLPTADGYYHFVMSGGKIKITEPCPAGSVDVAHNIEDYR